MKNESIFFYNSDFTTNKHVVYVTLINRSFQVYRKSFSKFFIYVFQLDDATVVTYLHYNFTF